MSRCRPFVILAALAAVALDARAQARDIRSGPQSDTLRLAIEEAVARAVRQSDESRLAAAQLDVTEALITTTRAAGLPQLRLSGAYTQVIENARANVVGSVFAQSFTYNTNANISQTLFQGGDTDEPRAHGSVHQGLIAAPAMRVVMHVVCPVEQQAALG